MKISKKHFNSKIFYRILILLLIFYIVPGYVFCQTVNHERVNVGLYGGASLDFAYDTNYRLFSAVRSPGSLFYSDDNCDTWTQAFPMDSLEYHSDERGWSGGRRVLTNRMGWVGVQTAEAQGTLTSSVISYDDGDSGTFITAFDNYILKQIEPSATDQKPGAIDLTDHWFYVGMNNYLLRTNDTSTYGPWNIVVDLDTVPLADTSTNILWISAANTYSGFPVLLVVYDNDDDYGRLLKFDGTVFTEISHPVSTYDYYFKKVFSHPVDTGMDTVIVSTKVAGIKNIKVFRSYNGGSSWTDITPSGGTNWPLQNADYSPYWESTMPVSNGLRLSFPGGDFSTDLGATWSGGFMEDNATAANPKNEDIIVCSKNKGPQISYDGGATFSNPDNEGHAAVSISKIAQLRRRTYYVATKAGLGYTIAYHNNGVLGVDKWKPPYGDFPISGVGNDWGVTAVDIDPNDSLHVVVGYRGGFYVSTTGPTGFTQVVPTDWDDGTHQDYMVTDVQFITSDTIIAVTGTGSNIWPSTTVDYGNIWRSTDGGNSWTKMHPSDAGVDFEQGNTVAVGYGWADTVIYVGCGYWDQFYPTVDGQLWKSTDFGDTWSYVNSGPESQMSGSYVSDMPIYDVDVYPGHPDTLFIASGENLDYAFAKSTDGGVTYSYINNMVPEGAFSSVMVLPDKPDIVACAARRDLWRTNVPLNSTTHIFEGFPGEFVPDLEYGSILMGTNIGMYKIPETPGSVITKWKGEGNWSDAVKWDNGIPYDICDVIIDSGKVEVDMDAETNNLTVSSGAAMTINSGTTLTVNNDFVLESKDDSSYASFIDNGTYTVNGDITVQRYLTHDCWHFISPPVSGDTAGLFMGFYLKYWEESDTTWYYITNPSDPLLAGKGYSSWLTGGSTGNTTIEYYGIPNTGDYSLTVTLSGDPAEYGWNLVGNPYPSAFDWDDASLTKSNIDNTIYFWDNKNKNYIAYNGTTHIGTGGATQYVPAQQGFFIHASDANPELTVTQSSRTHSNQKFLKNTEYNTENMLKLYVEGNGYKDEMAVMFNDNATDEFDSQYDAYKLRGSQTVPQLFTYDDYDDKLTINVQPFDGPVETVLTGFEAGKTGVFTLVASGIGNFPDDMGISIEDIETGNLIDLRTDSIYTFTANSTGNPQRFKLYFDGTALGVNQQNEINNDIKIYADSRGRINVKNTNGKSLNGILKIFDILGVEKESLKLNGKPWQQFNVNLTGGIYIVEILGDKRTVSQKIIIK